MDRVGSRSCPSCRTRLDLYVVLTARTCDGGGGGVCDAVVARRSLRAGWRSAGLPWGKAQFLGWGWVPCSHPPRVHHNPVRVLQ
jgi:hypothetical protein